MKKTLGLDLGTNSIGWAVISESTYPKIEKAGSRIIPMDAAILGDFEKGNSVSQTAQRTQARSVRRLRQRHLLRRERLLRVLNILGFLPQHYRKDIIFRSDNHINKRFGQIEINKEPKLAWVENADKKFEFLFKDSFDEMLSEFRAVKAELFVSKDGRDLLVPYGWTIYYLRQKALTRKISEQELAWILLNFNQKRGYYQLRGEQEDEQQEGKVKEYHILKVVDVQATDNKKGNQTWYNVVLENGWIYHRTSSQPLTDWIGKEREFIVTTDVNKDGTPKLNKDGEIKRSFSSPKEDDWTLIKKRTETEISKSGKTVGEYIYNALLNNPKQKINGKLVRVIERKFYEEELSQILETQSKFHDSFANKELLKECVEELYPNNKEHSKLLVNKDLKFLLINDILFYQRPLKSKKSLIGNCQYEQHRYIDPQTGEVCIKSLKVIAKSNPLFQEFRLWQFVSNLRIYKLSNEGDVDVTADFFTDIVEIFDWLSSKKEIDQKGFFSRKEFGLKKSEMGQYRWNYVVDKIYPCSETKALIQYRLEKNGLACAAVDTMALWHILYSVTDPKELEKALQRFAAKNSIETEKFVQAFKNCKPFDNDYGSYSEKAIKKLLALMRQGKHWSEEAIDESTRKKVDRIINGEFDENIDELTRSQCAQLTSISHFQGVPLHLACYIVYGRHSEASEITKWRAPEDIDTYLRSFRQHSLNNPIVEQVVAETLRTVRDIWRQSGTIDEIHIELGRELKNPTAVRKQITESVIDNENANLRIRKLLQEFASPEYGIQNVRPYSPSQQAILKIYEDSVLKSVDSLPEDIATTIQKFRESDIRKQPSKSDILRYKLWIEQLYRSPYTGEVIPLGKLFTADYEIEHIIPQSRLFDDAFSNKVICESEVNKLKDRLLGLEFVANNHGQKITLSNGKVVTVFEVDEYKKFVGDHYSNNRAKMKKLLLTEIPDNFNQRQLNDTRYITKLVKGLLSNIVREEGEKEATSKNVIVCSGGVTDRLKREWGLNDVWNDIVAPRFERLNERTGTQNFGRPVDVEGKRYFQTNMPIELSKGFSKKRIDHRHHAMDAIVIACASRDHVNYLNNVNAGDTLKYDLKHKLCFKTKPDADGNYQWQFYKPWDTFTQQVHQVLEQIVVVFKQNLRVINKTSNYTQHYNQEGKKMWQSQTKGENWAIRKSLHKDTVSGKVNLRFSKDVRLSEAIAHCEMIVDRKLRKEIRQLIAQGKDTKAIQKIYKEKDLSKTTIYYFSNDKENTTLGATRKSIDTSFDRKKIETSVTDSGIKKIMLAHLDRCDQDVEAAFSPEGIVRMNENMGLLNEGKSHQPIYKVRVYESLWSKFPVGITGNKSSKYVEADKGTNLFFAIYQDTENRRTFQTIPLNIVIERQKQGLLSASQLNEDGDKLLFALSPNDLVYVPTAEQIGQRIAIEDVDNSMIYKMVSCTGKQCHFIPHCIANSIVETTELGSNNKSERAWNGEMIKEICVPIKVDRLGNIIKIVQ